MASILDYTENNGLVMCSRPWEALNNTESLYLYDAQKLGVDAVLFRRYYNEGQSKPYRSEPAVCIFDKSSDFFNSDDHIKLHAALWSAARNEIYIINSPLRQDIVNARKPAKPTSNGKLSIESLLLASSATLLGINKEKFSAYLFGSGIFWEQSDFEKSLDEKNSPYIFLLEYLMAVRRTFLSSSSLKLAAPTIDKLLVTSILIRFLEEIKDDKGKHTLRSIYRKYKITTFSEAVDKGFCITILNELANEFNGRVFDNFSEKEKNSISKANLGMLANFLTGSIDVRTNQIFMWDQYSFKHLPAEVISAIYENFIQAEAVRTTGEKEKGIVYTPVHLVNLLVDEAMPLDKPELFKKEKFKVLDPACGSGVFLVTAFKRLLQWWAINNSKIGNIQYPDCKTAQKILEDNIFGVDVKETATLVSIFGLTTALLDKLTPQEIWNNLKFRDLNNKNIQHSNFFSWALKVKKAGIKFDLAIGNPPFNIETGKKREEVLIETVLNELNFKHKKLPDNNFALHFFEGAMLLAKRVSLIIPANVLLYNRLAQKYRSQIFTEYSINKIFDFTHLRRDLFHKTADTAIVAVIAENKPFEKNNIEHIVIKRTIPSERKLRFEIDYYDHYNVPLSWAIDDTKHFVWKCNLLGGGRLFQLINRLSLLNNLEEYIELRKVINDEWVYEVGYEAGAAKTDKVIRYIHGQDKITDIDENGVLVSNSKEASKHFYRPKNETLFTLPLLVIHKKIGDRTLPIGIKQRHQNRYLVFNSSFVGIHAPKSEYSELKRIYDRFKENEDTYLLWILNKSSSAMISQETAIKKTDLDTLPFPAFDQDEYLQLIPTEIKIREDVLNYYIHLGKAIGENSAGESLHRKVGSEQLEEFGKTYCEVLNEIYSKNEKNWQPGSVSQTDQYTIYQFGFGPKGGLSYHFGTLTDAQIKSIAENKLSNSGAIFTRIIRIYTHLNGYDCIFFIKPNAQRYWLSSIALRDADDTFIEFKNAGF